MSDMVKVLQLYSKLILVLAIPGLSVGETKTPASALKVNSTCKEIKCPAVSKPVCVELKFHPATLPVKTLYMELSNRCELKYISCYENSLGEAKVKELPMSYCDHGRNMTTDMRTLQMLKPALKENKLKKNKMRFPVKSVKKHQKESLKTKKTENFKTKTDTIKPADVKKRVKRATESKEQEYLRQAKLALFDDTEPASLIKFKLKKAPKKYKVGSSYNGMKDTLKSKVLRMGDDPDESIPNPDDATQKPDSPYLIYAKGPEEENKNASKENEEEFLNNKKPDDDGKGENGSGQFITEDEDPRELLVKEDAILDAADTDREEYEIKSQENAATEKVNVTDGESGCPKVCPARGVMLCARCKDNIYRTFLSGCHMRMFDCHHPDEKLELVSRLPCAMSGPYLEDLRVPEGVVQEPGDDDIVLRFLRCKHYNNSKLRPWSTIDCDFEKK